MTDHALTGPPSQPSRDPPSRDGVELQPSSPIPPWGEEEGSFDWRRYLSALIRHKWLVLLAALMGVGGAYLSWGQVEVEYAAQGSLWVNNSGAASGGPIVTDGLFPASSWVDLLRSFSVVDPVVTEQRLYLNPAQAGDLALFEDFRLAEDFTPGAYRLQVGANGGELTLEREGIVVDRAQVGNPIGTAVGFHWTPTLNGVEPGREVLFSVTSPRGAATRLREQIQASIDPERTFIRIELRGADPQRLVNVVNGLMEHHVALAAELKSGHLDEQAEVLARQLGQVEAELANAERGLEAFRIETITLPSDVPRAYEPGLEMTRGPVFDDFFQMRVEQEQLRRDRARIEEVLTGLNDSVFPVEAVEVIPSATISSELREAMASLVTARGERRSLLERYTPEHPPVREVSDRIRTLETNTLPALLRQLSAQLRQEEEMLAARLDASGESLGEIPPRTIEEGRLRRRVAIAESLYGDLRGRYEVASLARRSSIPDVRILDRAVAGQIPVTDRRLRRALVLFAGFLGAGMAGALLLDRLDSRVRTPEEISLGMGLPVLGTVPRIRNLKGARHALDHRDAKEAFRELRTNLIYAYGSAGPVLVTVSSGGMGEGKTFITAHLGLSFAELGRRTLIVDADTRRGDLHHVLGGRRKPGLTDLLRSAASWEDCLQVTETKFLHFIGSGTQVASSPELLSSPRMGSLFTALRKRYDVILVDSPPVGAGADPLVLSCVTGHFLLVVRSGSTNKEFTQAKLEPLGRLPVRLLGAVLNDFQPELLSSYHARYYSSYLAGYEAGSEEPDADQVSEPTPAPA
jgi:polysaccharide biosynthesis transport protein